MIAERLSGRILTAEALKVALIVVVTFAVYAALSRLIEDPRIFVDEIRYMDAAGSLADGHGLHTRGEAYGWAPGYPAILAPILALASGRPQSYAWIKAANAFFFALSAIPLYLLARRLVPSRGALVVAVLAVALPSSVYVGLVLTESLAYLVFSFAMLAFVLALEKPTTTRQFGALAGIGAAYLVRSQFAVLYLAYVVALACVVASESSGRRAALRNLWPTVVSSALLGAGAVGLLVVRGAAALGRYDDLWRSYDVVGVGRWLVYHVADLDLYVGLCPVVFVPAILTTLYRERDRAFFWALTTVTVGTLLVTAAFASTPFSEGRLHDRYLFYVVPLWVLAGARWIVAGAERSFRSLAAGIALLLLPVALLPFDRLVAEDPWRQLEATGTQIWSRLGGWTIGQGLTGHRAIAVVALVAVAATSFLPPRGATLLLIPVALSFVCSSALLWHRGIDASKWHAFPDRNASTLAWVDAAVPTGATVMLVDLSARCPKYGVDYALTEFYNDRVGPVSQLSRPTNDSLPTHWSHVALDGTLVGTSGRPLRGEWVVIPHGVTALGSAVAEGVRRHLVLWRVPGVLRFGDHSEAHLVARACSAVQSAASH